LIWLVLFLVWLQFPNHSAARLLFGWGAISLAGAILTVVPCLSCRSCPEQSLRQYGVHDKTVSLTDALDQTGCKERGVQSMSFNCSFNVANGSQTLFILPDITFSGHKKANVEVNTVKCVEHCDLLNPPVNP